MASSSPYTNDEAKVRILNVYPQFVSDVDPERLSDYLVQGNVITINQWQRIRHENSTNTDRCRALLSHLFYTQHPSAFVVVQEALEKENHYLLEIFDCQEPKCGIPVHSEKQTILPEVPIHVSKLHVEEYSKRTETTIKTLEAIVEKLNEDLKSEKTTNRALQSEVKNLLQELNNEKRSNEILQTDLDTLKQKIVTERKNADEELKKTKTESQNMILKLEANLAKEKEEMKQLIVKEKEQRRILAELRYKSHPVLIQRIGTRAARKEKKGICGWTILDGELYLVSHECSEVEIFDLKSLIFIRRWNLQELICPEDMTSCNRYKSLYIITTTVRNGSKFGTILRIGQDGRLRNIWSTGNYHEAVISVTIESNVILTVREKNKLNEYSPDGQLIREMDLSSGTDISYPWHAIKLADDHFLVSHGGYNAEELRRVCIIDAELRLKKAFGGKSGSGDKAIGDPVYMAIDGNGYVMVVDLPNARVLLLDSDLQFKKEILSKDRHGLQRPWGILLDETNGRLLVMDRHLKSNNTYLKDAPISIFEF